MGYLSSNQHLAYFVRMHDGIQDEFDRLLSIGRRTKSKRVKKKIAKRIDALIEVDEITVEV